MKNKVVEILNASERTDSQINFIVNAYGGVGLLGQSNNKAQRLKEEIEKLVKMVRDDMIEIHKLG